MKQSITNNITQILLIVFSVVLGLYLSERIEERKNEKKATKLLSKIKSEVNDNKKIIEEWAPSHRQIVKRLDSLINENKFIEDFINDESTLYKEVITRGTLMSEMPSNDTWDIAKSHPIIVNIDYDELLILSKVYNQQAITFEPVPKIIEILISTDLNSKEHAKQNLQLFKNHLQEVLGRELQLIGYYKQAEKILKF